MQKQKEIQIFSFQYDVMPRLIDYIEDIVEEDKRKELKLEEDNLKKGIIKEKTTNKVPHPRQETLDRLRKHGGFCSAFSLLILTSTLLSKIPKKDQSLSSESKTVRDDYETISHLFEIVARRNTLKRGEEQACDAACERIINYLFSIQIIVDTQKTDREILHPEEDIQGKKKYISYYEAVQISVSDKKTTDAETHQALSLEFQVIGYAEEESNLKKFIEFIPEDRIYSIGIHDANDVALQEDGHTIGLLKTVEKGFTVYYFVDQNGEHIRTELNNIDEVVDEILIAARKVKCHDGILIQCQSLKLNLEGLESKPAQYPEKRALLDSVHVAPEKNILCNTYAAINYDTESAEFYQEKQQFSKPNYIEKLDDQDEEFEEILSFIFPKLNFPASLDDKVITVSAKFLKPELINSLNILVKEMESPIKFERDAKKEDGVIIHNLTRESLKEATKSPKFSELVTLANGEREKYSSKSSGKLSLKSNYSQRFLVPNQKANQKEDSSKTISSGIR